MVWPIERATIWLALQPIRGHEPSDVALVVEQGASGPKLHNPSLATLSSKPNALFTQLSALSTKPSALSTQPLIQSFCTADIT